MPDLSGACGLRAPSGAGFRQCGAGRAMPPLPKPRHIGCVGAGVKPEGPPMAATRSRRRARGLVLALSLACAVPGACTSVGGLPGARPGDGEVQVFVARNHAVLLEEIVAGGGPALDAAMDLAGVDPATRDILRLRLQSELPLYRRSPLAMAALIAAHGAPTQTADGTP